MELAILGTKLIFLLGLIFFIIQSGLVLLVLWRHSLVKIYPLFLTSVFLVASLTVLAHAFTIFGKL